MVTPWTAVVLSGGLSRRLGFDKTQVSIAGRRLIDRVLDAIPASVPIVVVGPDPHAARAVTLVREDPPGGGPAAAVAAAVAIVDTEVVGVIAADMPFGVDAVRRLLPHLEADAVVPVTDGHPQPLCAVYRTAALRALEVDPGSSMRQVLAKLQVQYVPTESADFVDVDTPADLASARERLAGPEQPVGVEMDDWVQAVAQSLQVPASADVEVILNVAKDAAHAVARPAAPVTTYLLGLAVAAGADPAEAAATIAKLAASWQPAPDA